MLLKQCNYMSPNQLLDQLSQELATAQDEAGLAIVWQKYFGKQGLIKEQVKALAQLSIEEKREKGPIWQAAQASAQEKYDSRSKEIAASGQEATWQAEAQTIGLTPVKLGHLHPITETIRQLNQLFIKMGYSVMEDREIETDEFCFQRLNVPADHPARDMQDTFYLQEPNILLRTQTSSIESRLLATAKPPFKAVCPGRVYRNETVNKSNHFIFHHYQGVVVMEKVSLADLFGTFTALFQEVYGPEVKIRFRNKYYPEVEPGVGPDMQCFNCGGTGCPVCKGVGWIEMGGAGIIHPKVMAMAGLDTSKWQGFAFGLGLDRWAMARHNITDIRTLLGGNLGYKPHDHENTL